jgi:hypothetical protein
MSVYFASSYKVDLLISMVPQARHDISKLTTGRNLRDMRRSRVRNPRGW